MLADYLKFSFNNLRHRRLRSWLTMLGIFIGIAAVVALISIGQGMQRAITEQFEQLGKDKITIQPGAVQLGAPGSEITTAKLTDHDIDLIKKVRGVSSVAGLITKIAKINFNDEISHEFVSGLPLDESREMLEEMQSYKIVKGRDLEQGDKYKAVIGYGLANAEIFKKEVKLRDKILIEGREFRVVGTLDRIGNRYDDGSFLIPLETAKEIFNTENYAIIIVEVKEEEAVSEIAEAIKEEMRKDRNLEKGEEDFRIETAEQLLESFTRVFGIIQIVFIGIAAISLVVGGIGIMNTMYTSVLERTRQIGIMKAIGAKNIDILSLFLIESGLLGLVGGAIGIGLGIGIGKIVEIIASQALGTTLLKASFTPLLIFGALTFSFLVGCISGTLPAMQASRMKPADALRYE